MDPIIEPSVRLMGLNASLFEQAAAGLTDDQLWAMPGEGSNPMLWILAHATGTRDTLLGALTGQKVARPWFASFGRGSARPVRQNSPSVAEVKEAMSEVTAKLNAAFAAQTSGSLERPAPFQVPASDGTMRGLIAFLSCHETYHVGQAGYLRRWLGYPGIFG
jgi:uncharacterized damage-inducible protein DinB